MQHTNFIVTLGEVHLASITIFVFCYKSNNDTIQNAFSIAEHRRKGEGEEKRFVQTYDGAHTHTHEQL